MSANPYEPATFVKIEHPDWSKNATIYQINLRQFTAEGTLRAAESHLPHLKDLGADILWLMPINPIGKRIARAAWEVRMRFGIIWQSILNLGISMTCGISSVRHTPWECM